jgi:hypothetical protein
MEDRRYAPTVPPGLAPYMASTSIIKSLKRNQKRMLIKEGGVRLSDAENLAKERVKEVYGIDC